MRVRGVTFLLSLASVLWSPSLHAVPVANCGSACQAAQVGALVDLYTATQGSQWLVSEGWSSLTSATSISTVCAFLYSNQQGWCCNSDQVLCPVEYGISVLALEGNNLKGTLPESLSALGPTLLSVVLSSMEPHAASFVTLTCSCCNLSTCFAHADNQLSGTLPSFASAPYLRDVILANNNLTGPVPSTLFSLPQAYRIDLVIQLISNLLPPICVPSAAFLCVFAGG